MLLSKENIKSISLHSGNIALTEDLFSLPEKVLQFGTGVLLRGLPDYFIDKANKRGIFNGRIVVIKSTAAGGVDAFDRQDGLYTICVRGIEGETKTEENIINASISRVLSAKSQWGEILKCAGNPAMQVVISNTTEVGITLVDDNIHASPPESFPGKLLAFMYRRYQIFDGAEDKGMVIVPTELIIDNGKKLKNILLELSAQHKLDNTFVDWLSNHNYFCNSLVDRIVPGKLTDDQQQIVENQLGYQDELMIMSEAYRLWAIETNEPKVAQIITFSQANPGIVIAGDINVFRELKLRLLNGSHTFSCGLAYLCGFNTVKEAMDNKFFLSYITGLMHQEISPALVSNQITPDMARDFANKVIDRYRNPDIEHQWLSISAQYTSKMRMRNVPVIQKYYERFGTTPELMTLGFAAFLLFLKAEKQSDGKFHGTANKKSYSINDDNVAIIADKWGRFETGVFVKEVLADKNLWEVDLSKLPGFVETLTTMIHSLQQEGALAVLKRLSSRQATEQAL
ncbi:MAG TPA: tagaturonate reductase [Flavitalea sp.]|nr:tagaturonate reductase [Flavitalea sp.]